MGKRVTDFGLRDSRYLLWTRVALCGRRAGKVKFTLSTWVLGAAGSRTFGHLALAFDVSAD